MSTKKNNTFQSLVKKILCYRNEHGSPWITLYGAGEEAVSVPLDPRRSECRNVLSQYCGGQLSRRELEDLIQLLSERARKGPMMNVFVRIGNIGDVIALDLGRPNGESVRIEPGEWDVVTRPPVTFYRPKGMLELPLPLKDHLELLLELEPFLEPLSRPEKILFTAWLIGAMNPAIPQVVLEIYGPQGSGKSTRAKLIRCCIDPHTAGVRRISRDERDLFIGAFNSWVLSVDNVSVLPAWFSDAVCCIATGGSFATRRLYFDDEETIFSVRRPVIVNSIHPVILRPDLQDRAISICLPEVTANSRQKETDYWRRFNEALPRILGALLTCASGALMTPEACPDSLPRMADWFQWNYSAAASSATGYSAEEFERAYNANREAVHQIAIDASPIGRTLFQFAKERGRWSGTLSELLGNLRLIVDWKNRAKEWPDTPEKLRHAIDRIVPSMAQVGVMIRFEKGTSRKRERRIILDASGAEQ